MTQVAADFDLEELNDIRQCADRLNMTTEQFVEYATNEYINKVKEDAKAKLYTTPKLRLHK